MGAEWKTATTKLPTLAIVIVLTCSRIFCQYENQDQCPSKLSSLDQAGCAKNQGESTFSHSRYMLYDVTPAEGFNLRRDVYIRMAMLTKELGPEWILVLPPWVSLYHWKNRYRDQSSNASHLQRAQPVPWSTFFDLDSLAKFVPVIELDEYLSRTNGSIDQILSISHFEDAFNGDYSFSERVKINKCTSSGSYIRRDDNKIHGWFWSLEDKFTAKSLFCLNLEGFTSTVANLIKDNFDASDSIMIIGSEVILHKDYGTVTFWAARRSMRYADGLINMANSFRRQYLDSWDEKDETMLEKDWTKMRREHGITQGGPYLAVHLRRRDFAKYRPNDVPDLQCAAQQIIAAATRSQVKKVFIATDADQSDWRDIMKFLEKSPLSILRYQNDSLKPGEEGIIDQWICAHGKIFIGTLESTFSFRIQEDREILGLHPETTFLAFCPKCGTKEKICKQQSQWKIVYD